MLFPFMVENKALIFILCHVFNVEMNHNTAFGRSVYKIRITEAFICIKNLMNYF